MFYLHFHIIYNIFGTNILTECPVPVFVCFCPCIAKKGEKSKCSENSQKIPKILVHRKRPPAGGCALGVAHTPQAPLGRGQGGGRATWPPGPGGPPPRTPFGPYLYSRGENPESRTLFSRSNSDIRRHRQQALGD